MTFEQRLPTEDADIAQIVQGILTIQARYAAEQHRPLGRGTHTKGVCVGATFEVFDLTTSIVDPALARRLGRGLFAQPGIYAATVRFANAASKLQSDRQHDVRALSFAVDVPAGTLGGPGGRRVDFSMNSAPVFPINDAHAFAALMKVDTAVGLGKLVALLRLPWRDIRGVLSTARLGLRQQRIEVKPYQHYRYWSTVPFLHGDDEAMKYSAIPVPTNPARPLGKGRDALADELIRHVNDDGEMSVFDFAIQLLDAGRMAHRGTRREPSFWIENAAVDWDEQQAPFHRVARLTLQPKSARPPAACAAFAIDVTENRMPENRPIGSINRARWTAEAASRNVRLAAAPPAEAEPAAAAPPSLVGRVAAIRMGTVVRWTTRALLLIPAVILLFALATVTAIHFGYGILPEEDISGVVYPDQGWGDGVNAAGRQTYYYTPQGAGLKDLRYRWFLNLELPLSTRKLSDPDVMRRYGFVVDAAPSPMNPDHLPVGFSKHFDRELNEELLDITCAACHTGQLTVRGPDGRLTALRIDGGTALHAILDSTPGHFAPTLLSSMLSTVANPFKFRRFARAVLGDEAYDEGYWTLHREMLQVIGHFLAMGWQQVRRDLTPTTEGYGRTDALARIANAVFGEHIDGVNYRQGSAPVNYPPVWNIWKFDWVQYNASVSQPMARNLGEAMGTGAKYTLVDRYGRPLPPEQRFRSTALVENLHTIELTLRRLRPPAWNEALLGPIDRARAERGRDLFREHCEGCHGPFIAPPAMKARNAPLKTDADPEWLVRTLCVDDIGTDPAAAANFAAQPGMDITRTGLTSADLQRVARVNAEPWRQRQIVYLTSEIARLQQEPATPGATAQIAKLEQQLAEARNPEYLERELARIDPRNVSVGAGLSYLGVLIREKAYADAGYTPEQIAEYNGFGILDLPQVIVAYKPRPLAGIWATPPYLHNGSVPTVYDLLSPVADRPATFRVGSREYDPVKLGLKQAGPAFRWVLDTRKDGNYNTGHEFNRGYDPDIEGPQGGLIGPLLSHDERMAIIEHLKVRDDDVDGPKTPRVPPQCR